MTLTNMVSQLSDAFVQISFPLFSLNGCSSRVQLVSTRSVSTEYCNSYIVAFPYGLKIHYEVLNDHLTCTANQWYRHARVHGDPHFNCPANGTSFDFDGHQDKLGKV